MAVRGHTQRVSGKIGVSSKADSVFYLDDYRVVPATEGVTSQGEDRSP